MENLPELLIALGLVILAIEVAILGFATFILLFLGISLVITGFAMWIGFLPETLTSILASNAILTSILAVALWQPLKRMQDQTETKTVSNDFMGLTFVINESVDRRGLVLHKYSGISWQLKSEVEIAKDTEVKVVKAEVGILWVKPT